MADVPYDQLLTAISTIASVGAAWYSMQKAEDAREANEAARAAMKSVQFSALSERLRSAQEHIRDISPHKSNGRGFNSSAKIDAIRREFDNVLSALPSDGPGQFARKSLSTAQNHLNSYENSLQGQADASQWQMLQVSVQNAVSQLISDASEQGSKYDE